MDINNKDDIIDTRDIQERIDELEAELNDIEEQIDELNQELNDLADEEEESDEENRIYLELQDLEDKKDDIEEELNILNNIKDDVGSEFNDGVTLIRETYFEEYCEELLVDVGDLPRNIPWYIEIDWEKTAENIKQDYSIVDFDGITYYFRN